MVLLWYRLLICATLLYHKSLISTVCDAFGEPERHTVNLDMLQSQTDEESFNLLKCI